MNPRILVYVNGEELDFKTAPIMENNRVLVPARVIFEKLGAEVLWDETTQTVLAVKENMKISLQINNTNMYFDDKLYVSDVIPIIVNDTTMIPVRAVAEALCAEVDWNDDTKEVKILSPT